MHSKSPLATGQRLFGNFRAADTGFRRPGPAPRLVGRPEVLGGVGSPGAPRLGAGDEVGRARPSRPAVEGAKQADIADGQGVRQLEGPHGDVLRGPGTDARNRHEARHRRVEAVARGEQVRSARTAAASARTAAPRARGMARPAPRPPPPGPPAWGRGGRGQRRRGRERGHRRLPPAAPRASGPPPRRPAGPGSPGSRLERVPGAGQAQARPGGDEAGEMGIARQARADGRRVGIAVELAAQAGLDLGEVDGGDALHRRAQASPSGTTVTRPGRPAIRIVRA